MKQEYPLLESINSIEDFLQLPDSALDALAGELRMRMIDVVQKNGGHLASSLGAVELIIAMHRVFDLPEDRMVFDVGHQAYAHKLLTGRNARFDTLRQEGGISGFPKRAESRSDAFDTGHASTSISAALGIARAKQLRGEPGMAVALIGDGALTGGMALEALNDAGESEAPLVVILNDNDMAIAESVGSLRRSLTNMRTSQGYLAFKRRLARLLDTGTVGRWLSRHMQSWKNRIKSLLLPHMLFEEMGFTYLGPIDGHNISELIRMLRRARKLQGPVLVHAVTRKGYGFAPAEQDPEKFHGVSPAAQCAAGRKSNSEVFGAAMMELAERDERVVAITAAMPRGTGLAGFAARFPSRFFDVGIAEQHAVTMAAGMAAGGLRPVVAIYSSFLQRGYDQLLHDVCLQRLPVVCALDRAGLVGEDGETHQGVYDIAYLSAMPGMAIYSPATQQELVCMLQMAVERGEPAAIRYNRGSLMQALTTEPVVFGRWETILPVADVTVVATGCMVELAMPVARETGAGLINARFLHALDEESLRLLRARAKRVITMEDGVVCFGERMKAELSPIPVTALGVPNEPIAQGTIAEQRARCNLTAQALRRAILEA